MLLTQEVFCNFCQNILVVGDRIEQTAIGQVDWRICRREGPHSDPKDLGHRAKNMEMWKAMCRSFLPWVSLVWRVAARGQ